MPNVVIPHDRLWLLSTYRLVLRHNGFPTPASVVEANPQRRADLHVHAAGIIQLVQAGDPDVILALFVPRERVDWQVAGYDGDRGARMLSVWRGNGARVDEHLVQITYRVDDGGTGEREAWASLRDVLRRTVRML
jgi:hypothetical protein